MVEPEIELTPSGHQTVRIGGTYLQSKFNPYTESERILQTILRRQPYKVIICLNPGIAYFSQIVTNQAMDLKILNLYTKSFFGAIGQPGALVWFPQAKLSLFSFLLSHINESLINHCHVYVHQAYAELFPIETQDLLSAVKTIFNRLAQNRHILTHFHRRWFLNAMKNLAVYTFSQVQSKSTGLSLLIASGPSLNQLNELNRQRLISTINFALPSSLKFCAYYAIPVQVCIQSDGGYWASRHLEYLQPQTRLLHSLRAHLANSLQKNQNQLLPFASSAMEQFVWHLAYDVDLPELPDAPSVAIPASIAVTNLHNGPVYFVGLDMASHDTQFHANPHTFADTEQFTASRLGPVESRRYTSLVAGDSNRLVVDDPWLTNRTTRAFREAFQDFLPIAGITGQIGPSQLAIFPSTSFASLIEPNLATSLETIRIAKLPPEQFGEQVRARLSTYLTMVRTINPFSTNDLATVLQEIAGPVDPSQPELVYAKAQSTIAEGLRYFE